MIPNIAQSIDEIIQGATPAQKIIWQQVRLITGENASIRQRFYSGSNPALLYTYSANKLFLANELEIYAGAYNGANIGYASLYDETNALMLRPSNVVPYYNGVAVAYVLNTIEIRNVYFSKIDLTEYLYIKFNGYEIGY